MTTTAAAPTTTTTSTTAPPPPTTTTTQLETAGPVADWFFLDEHEQRIGPVTFDELCLRCNNNGNTLVWNATHAPQWVFFHTLYAPGINGAITQSGQNIVEEQWYVLEKNANNNEPLQLGPLSRWDLVSRVSADQIHKDALVWSPQMISNINNIENNNDNNNNNNNNNNNPNNSWIPLHQIGEFKNILNFVDKDAPFVLSTSMIPTSSFDPTSTSTSTFTFTSTSLTISSDLINDPSTNEDNLENSEWFYRNETGTETGPISLPELLFLQDNGTLHASSLVRMGGTQEWLDIATVQDMIKQDKKKINNSNSTTTTKKKDSHSHKHNQEGNNTTTEEKNESNPTTQSSHDDSNENNTTTNGESGNNNGHNNKKRGKKRKWKNVKNNTSVYISGLPSDITEDEVYAYFSQCGFLKKELYSGQWKIKLYKNEDGTNKGDGLVTYFKPESVSIAVQMLDETEIKPGYPIHVEEAQFECHGEYEPTKRRKLNATERKVLREMHDLSYELSWDENEDKRAPRLHIVIMKPMFTLDQVREAENSDVFYQVLKNEIHGECSKIGDVEKITIFEDSPLGAVAVKFTHPKDAQECINRMNRRYFDERIIECFYWDGVTDYRCRESEEEQMKRLEHFQQDLLKNDSHSKTDSSKIDTTPL